MKAFRRRCQAISRASRRPHRRASNTPRACRERRSRRPRSAPARRSSGRRTIRASAPAIRRAAWASPSTRPSTTACRRRIARVRPNSNTSIARETLRVTEQTILLNGATVYMDLLRDTALLELQRRNVEVLQEQLRQTRDRFIVGEVTRTDVAQAETNLAAGRAQVLVAEAQSCAIEGDLPSGRLRRGRYARAGRASGSPAAAEAAGCGSDRPGASSERRRRHVRHRFRGAAGQDQRGFALSDRDHRRHRAAAVGNRSDQAGARSSSTPSCSASSACRSTRAARNIR